MKNLNRWIYAVIGVVALLMAGLVYAWSVISKSITASRPDWTATQLSLTFTLVMIFFCIGGLIAGVMAKRVSTRLYLLFSGLFFAAGFMVASMAGGHPALRFGVLCGLGAGLAYNAVMSTMSLWFPDKQGLISGIMLMGFGFSSFIIGKIYAKVTPSDGSDAWQGTFRVLGVIILVVMLICSFFLCKPDADFNPTGKNAEKTKPIKEPAMEAGTGQMMRMGSFWAYYVWATVISAAGLVLVSQASGIVTEVGTSVPDGTIATVVGLISVFNGIGRVIFGALFDKKGYRLSLVLCMALFFVTAVLLIFALSHGSFLLLIFGFIAGGLAYGGVPPMNSAIISDFFGREHYAVNYSVINSNLIIASIASTVAGKLFDATQSYMATIVMIIILVIAGMLVSVGVRRPGKKAKKNNAVI